MLYLLFSNSLIILLISFGIIPVSLLNSSMVNVPFFNNCFNLSSVGLISFLSRCFLAPSVGYLPQFSHLYFCLLYGSKPRLVSLSDPQYGHLSIHFHLLFIFFIFFFNICPLMKATFGIILPYTKTNPNPEANYAI